MPLDALPPADTIDAAGLARLLGELTGVPVSERTARRRLADWYTARAEAPAGSPATVPHVDRVGGARAARRPPPRPKYTTTRSAVIAWALLVG